MNYSDYLVNRLKEVLTTGKWVTGTNFLAEIQDMDYHLAVSTIQGSNSIYALIFHITYYLKGVADALETGELIIRDKYSFDAPSIGTEGEWQKTITKYSSEADRFIRKIVELTEAEIQGDFIDARYGTMLRNIDVMIEHVYYHLGQVKLIKKQLMNQS